MSCDHIIQAEWHGTRAINAVRPFASDPAIIEALRTAGYLLSVARAYAVALADKEASEADLADALTQLGLNIGRMMKD